MSAGKPAAARGPWSPQPQPVSVEQPGGLVTIVEGSSFILSDRSGDVRPGDAAGLFVLDARVLSTWELLIDGHPLEPLSASVTEPYCATFVAHPSPQRVVGVDSSLLVVRQRWVGDGMREDLQLRNYSTKPVTVALELRVASDMAGLFEVKAGRARVERDPVQVDDVLHTSSVRGGVRRSVKVTERAAGEPGVAGHEGLSWALTIPAKGQWRTCLEVATSLGDRDIALQYGCGERPAAAKPSQRLVSWRRRTPLLVTEDQRLKQAIGRAVDDIGSLVIEDPAHPDSPVVAAGAPWFMALFGRDSLLASYMSLIVDPGLAIGVAQTLARLQGVRVDAATEEQPGRILHEVRFTSETGDGETGHIYYGTADATPLFVVLVGELSRWGVSPSVIDGLLPHVDRALEWIERYGDRDGDGYVEYRRLTPEGLLNQGWKDSWDGISDADGELASSPIALAEVQGYVYAAYRARAELARLRSDTATAERYESKAAVLATAFDRDFWVPDRGWLAVALDGDKRQVDSLASNMGHCLWSGIILPARAPAVAAQLMSPQMFSGWGVRTLAETMPRYNPLSYHNGSVWPHDSAIAAAGLMRYGFVDESCRLIDAVLDAAAANSGRLPELYAGVDRSELPVPVGYPTSCSPQAWASAAPLLLLRTLLRLEPRLDIGTFATAPVAGNLSPDEVELSFAGSRIRIRVDDDRAVAVTGLPADVAVVTEPRRETHVPARPQP
ncbi:MAG TPA: glycogen debranching N-terminal domain-containing protein [Acidimicrobiales bacterium]|nr:glycogen debranching N-terminal domain-containing protein [Acidimicrobiales bacterium]